MLRANFADPARGQRRTHFLQAVAAVALDQPFDKKKEIGPDGLWASEPAPEAATECIHEDQDSCRYHQASDVIELLRPDFDEEAVKPAVFEVEQDGLVRLAGPAVPAQEGRDVVDPERRQNQNRPFEPTDMTLDGLRDNSSRRSPPQQFCARAGVVDLDGERHVRTG